MPSLLTSATASGDVAAAIWRCGCGSLDRSLPSDTALLTRALRGRWATSVAVFAALVPFFTVGIFSRSGEQTPDLSPASMDDLPFDAEEFDVIWSEGAAYNVGFAEAARYWRQFLRPGGILVVSEITWTTAQRPREIEDFWVGQYPQIDLASAKIEVLDPSGYRCRGSLSRVSRMKQTPGD